MKHKYERLQPPNVFNFYLGQANKSDSDLKYNWKLKMKVNCKGIPE